MSEESEDKLLKYFKNKDASKVLAEIIFLIVLFITLGDKTIVEITMAEWVFLIIWCIIITLIIAGILIVSIIVIMVIIEAID